MFYGNECGFYEYILPECCKRTSYNQTNGHPILSWSELELWRIFSNNSYATCDHKDPNPFLTHVTPCYLCGSKSFQIWRWHRILCLCIIGLTCLICTLRKPQRLTFSHGNQVRLTDFQFGTTGFEFVCTGSELKSCESNSIPVETTSNPVCQTWFLWKKVSLRGFRSTLSEKKRLAPLCIIISVSFLSKFNWVGWLLKVNSLHYQWKIILLSCRQLI